MARRYQEARKKTGLTAAEAADRMEISKPTVNAWEAERKTPSIEGLEKMAALYQVTTDYLLGRPEPLHTEPEQKINLELLNIYDGMPVWSAQHGWALVNAAKQMLVLKTGKEIPFADCLDLFIAPPQFSTLTLPTRKPLSRSEVSVMDEIWVEPISPDQELRQELRGWYQVKGNWAENSAGNRFSLDTYAAKWLAFDSVEIGY